MVKSVVTKSGWSGHRGYSPWLFLRYHTKVVMYALTLTFATPGISLPWTSPGRRCSQVLCDEGDPQGPITKKFALSRLASPRLACPPDR